MGWLSGWAKRVKITVDSGDIDSNLSQFPVLVYLSASSGISSDDVSFVFDELGSDANRKKIAVTKSDGTTELYVEIEKWDHANEKAWLWVSRDGWTVASGSDTDFYLYYDSSHVDNDTYVGDPNSTPAEKVWDSNYKLVTHMRDDPDTSSVRDSTGNDNDGTKGGAGTPTEITGKIGDGQDFDGTIGEYISVTDDPTIDIGTNDITLEAWFKSTYDANVYIISKGTASSEWYSMHYNGASGKMRGYIYKTALKTVESLPGNDDGVWRYCAITFDRDGNAQVYINGVTSGVAVDISSQAGDLTNINDLIIGAYDSLGYRFVGGLDEVRISDTLHSSAWVKACYETQRDHLLSYGSEETPQQVGTGKRIFIGPEGPRVRIERLPLPRDVMQLLADYLDLKHPGD